MERRVLRRGLRSEGSKKGPSRRHLEGRSTPFRDYDPLARAPYSNMYVKLRNARLFIILFVPNFWRVVRSFG